MNSRMNVQPQSEALPSARITLMPMSRFPGVWPRPSENSHQIMYPIIKVAKKRTKSKMYAATRRPMLATLIPWGPTKNCSHHRQNLPSPTLLREQLGHRRTAPQLLQNWASIGLRRWQLSHSPSAVNSNPQLLQKLTPSGLS